MITDPTGQPSAPPPSPWAGALVDAGFTFAGLVHLGAAAYLVELWAPLLLLSPVLATAHVIAYAIARHALPRGPRASASGPERRASASGPGKRSPGTVSVVLIALGLLATIAGRAAMPMFRVWPDDRFDLGGILLGGAAGLGVLFFSAARRWQMRSPGPWSTLIVAVSAIVLVALSLTGLVAAGRRISRDYRHALLVENRTATEIQVYEGDWPIEGAPHGEVHTAPAGGVTSLHYFERCNPHCGWLTTPRDHLRQSFPRGLLLVIPSGSQRHLPWPELNRRIVEVGAGDFRIEVAPDMLSPGTQER
ncbi:MAG: hypothetical protein QM820_18215 [Minicystis sp.]